MLQSKNEEVNAEFFRTLTSSIIIKFAFGSQFDPEWLSRKWHRLTHILNRFFLTKIIFGNLAGYIPLPSTLEKDSIISEIRSKVKQVLRTRKSEIGKTQEANNLVDLLLSASEPVPEELIIDECLTFLLAGSETTSKLLAWTFYHLGMYPDIQAKIHQEVDEVLGQREITNEDIPKLSFCKCVLQEVLRMTPPAIVIDKLAKKDVMVGGHLIPKGTCILLFFWSAHYDNRYWDKPHEFRPERFLQKDCIRHPFAFMPFSAGERNCIGQKFALQEALIILPLLMQNFKITTNPSKEIRFVGDPGLTPEGLKIRFEKRGQ